MSGLSPFVYWAQSETEIFLKVDLRDVKHADVKALEGEVQFAANGYGAKGQNRYSFHLPLYLPIDAQDTHYHISDRQVDFHIPKRTPKWWPRLTAQPQKPAWLKIDFDRWKSEDDSEPETETPRDILHDYPQAYEKLSQEEYGYKVESLRKVYLFLYNLFQLVMCLYIVTVMVIRYSKDGDAAITSTYDSVGMVAKVSQVCAILEVFHPLLGFTKGSVLKTFIQVLGRSLVLFVMIDSEPRMHSKPVVFYLFLAWYSIEIIRYPFYMFQVYKVEYSVLTWLRYTLWIVLYPVGFICEGIIYMRCIPYFEETGRFSVFLPNAFNVSFFLPNFIRVYLLFLFLPGMYTMMSYMAKQRSSKLGLVKQTSKFKKN